VPDAMPSKSWPIILLPSATTQIERRDEGLNRGGNAHQFSMRIFKRLCIFVLLTADGITDDKLPLNQASP
jgi:hypothetical protein